MTTPRIPALAAVAFSFAFASSAHAVAIHTTDFIDDAARTAFVSFDSLPSISSAITHIESGVIVSQIDPTSILAIDSACAACFGGALDGSGAWTSLGGDYGYTSIMHVDATGFQDIGFFTGSSRSNEGDSINLMYSLWNNGTLVTEGFINTYPGQLGYLGFSGGGFNEVRVRDSVEYAPDFFDGTQNGFAIDSIETGRSAQSVPEPSTLALAGLTLALLGFGRRKA